MAICCPKSVKACAVRLTRLQDSGLPYGPLTPDRTVQGSGFAELTLSPDYEAGEKVDVRSPGGELAVIHRDFDALRGFDVSLRLCGLPLMLDAIGLNPLGEPGTTARPGFALSDSLAEPLCEPFMLELWSRNATPPEGVDDCARWIHWVLPYTSHWTLSSDLSFTAGALEVEISGYARQNEWWWPAFPGPTFPAYNYTSGLPEDPAPGWLPSGVTADEWTLDDLNTIRASGPLAWRCVSALPEPLDDCDYVPSADCSNYRFVPVWDSWPAGPITVEPNTVEVNVLSTTNLGFQSLEDAIPWSATVPGYALADITIVGSERRIVETPGVYKVMAHDDPDVCCYGVRYASGAANYRTVDYAPVGDGTEYTEGDVVFRYWEWPGGERAYLFGAPVIYWDPATTTATVASKTAVGLWAPGDPDVTIVATGTSPIVGSVVRPTRPGICAHRLTVEMTTLSSFEVYSSPQIVSATPLFTTVPVSNADTFIIGSHTSLPHPGGFGVLCNDPLPFFDNTFESAEIQGFLTACVSSLGTPAAPFDLTPYP
jgi:hypothetical protein